MTMSKPGVVEWLQKQSIFLTGGSGFVGQALLYKLLTCGCENIYIMMRPRKDLSPEQRVDNIIGSHVFQNLREVDKNLRNKLIPISGEVKRNGLYLDDEDRKTLENKVTVVFHVAASVKFDDPLSVAVPTNLMFTRDVLELAKKMKHLEIFHYVSTAYSNFDRGEVTEELFPPKMDWRKLVSSIESLPLEVQNCLERKLIGKSENTYVFTKHLAESAVADAAKEIPIVISRPPVVSNSSKEPHPGWMCNLTSPIGIIGGSAKGVLRVYAGPGDRPKSYVPVDYCANMIIASTWHEAGKRCHPPPIYHSDYMPLSPNDLCVLCFNLLHIVPMANILWYPRFHAIDTLELYWLAHILLHVIPGYLLDGILLLAGKQPRLSRIYRKMYHAFTFLYPVVRQRDRIKCGNWKQLENSMTEEENDKFPISLEKLRTPAAMNNYVQVSSSGFRRFIGDPPVPSKRDYKHLRMLYFLDRGFLITISALAMWYFPYGLLLRLSSVLIKMFVPEEFLWH